MTGPSRNLAGWYDDGSGTGTLRFWDGNGWTERTTSAAMPYGPAAPAVSGGATASSTALTDAAPPSPAPPTPKPKPHVLSTIALSTVVIGFALICIPISLGIGGTLGYGGRLGLGLGLMLIAFALSIVALTRNGAKWPAVTGLIVSIVGWTIALLISMGIVSTPFGDMLGEFGPSVP